MKKSIITALSAVFSVCVAVGLVGCMRQKEDCIPKELGTAEGLYVYYDNYRSLTDGTQTERLLNDVVIDGVTYTADEYEIQSLKYMQSQKEIFYSLQAQKQGEAEKYVVWHYNYDTKQDGLLYEFEENSIFQTVVETSENYLYAYCYNGYGGVMKGVLFDGDLNLISDEFEWERYRLKGDCVYDSNPVEEFKWWKNGQFGRVETVNRKVRTMTVTDNYAYLMYENEIFLIDTNTGEHKSYTLGETEKINDCTVWKDRYYAADGESCYFITSSQTTLTNVAYFSLQTGCKLYRLRGVEMTCIYTFAPAYEVRFKSFDKRCLNLEMERFETHLIRNDKVEDYSAYYDLEKGTFVMGKTQKAESIYTKHRRMTVGKYEFYTSDLEYQDGAIWDPAYCYYLHRVTDGKDEIMQYHFTKDDDLGGYDTRLRNPVLFDDICEK